MDGRDVESGHRLHEGQPVLPALLRRASGPAIAGDRQPAVPAAPATESASSKRPRGSRPQHVEQGGVDLISGPGDDPGTRPLDHTEVERTLEGCEQTLANLTMSPHER